MARTGWASRRSSGVDTECARVCVAVAVRRVGVEAVVDACGVDAAARELVARQVVDDDVPPRGIVERQLVDVRVLRQLPRRIVVMHHCRAAREHAADGARRR